MSNNYDFAKRKLMTPGPVPLPQYVKFCFAELECHHRSKEFADILQGVFNNLKVVFQTRQHCFLLPCTGTGAMEAAVVNTLSPGDQLLTINSGKFGERWGKIGSAFGLKVKELTFPWGKKIDLQRVKRELDLESYSAVAFQVCETSTGAYLPVKEIAELTKDKETLCIADGITGLGALDIPMDEWGVDILIGGSQKAFMLPTGMAFLSLSEKAQSKESTIPKYYWDLVAEKKSNSEAKTRYSTPSHFILALDCVLKDILKKGLANHFLEIRERAQFFREQIQLELFPENPCPSLTCVTVGEGRSAVTIKKKLDESGITIVAGQDQLKDKVLRVGHMGNISKEDLQLTADLINQNL